jgi:hypothetical protein
MTKVLLREINVIPEKDRKPPGSPTQSTNTGNWVVQSIQINASRSTPFIREGITHARKPLYPK